MQIARFLTKRLDSHLDGLDDAFRVRFPFLYEDGADKRFAVPSSCTWVLLLIFPRRRNYGRKRQVEVIKQTSRGCQDILRGAPKAKC